MAVLGPLIAAALWPWLWADPLHRIASAVSAAPFDTARLFLSRLLHPAHPPWGEPLLTTAMALPVTLVLVFAVGLLHSLLRLFRALLGGPDLSSELFLLLAALSPLAAAQLGFLPRGSGLGPWLPSFPLLSALGARAILSAARTVSASFSGRLAIVLSVATLIPGIAASIHSYPELGASWGEIPGGTPGAATLGLPRQDGEAVAALLPEISAHARPSARILWWATSSAALSVYAKDGRIRPDLAIAASPEEADLVVVPLTFGPRLGEYRAWSALHTSTPAAGAYLDEVPLAWVYARPGAWR